VSPSLSSPWRAFFGASWTLAAHLLLSAVGQDGGGTALDQAGDELRSALVDMDSTIRNESLPGLGERELDAAVRDRAAELERVSSAKIEVSGNLPGLSPFVATHVYRVIQEALVNAVRHADARNINLWLTRGGDRLHVVVRDDGRGVPASVGSGATGMRSMRSRAESLGGVLRVARGANGRGTLVAPRVPYSRALAGRP
jgi:two-component system, NarL family, sensor kinase